MNTAVARRTRALRELTTVLRGDPGAPVPDDAPGWAAFLELASVHGLLPAVWAALRASGRVTIPDAVLDALERAAPSGRVVPEVVLRRAYAENTVRVHRLLGTGVEILQWCAAESIRAVPLKGLHSLLAGTWSDPAVRTMADLDILVDPPEASRAFAMLRARGFGEHPDPIGEHADHHLPMLQRGDVTVELHTELLVSRWQTLAPAADVLRRARHCPTPQGEFLLADETDTLVHLVAHAQLQEETYTLLGLPLRALFETARLDPRPIDWNAARARFARASVDHVFDAHVVAAHELFAANLPIEPSVGRATSRARVHLQLAEAGVAVPDALGTWTYVVRLPRSFAHERMVDEFGTPAGAAWLWRSRARHAARRVAARLGRDGNPPTH